MQTLNFLNLVCGWDDDGLSKFSKYDLKILHLMCDHNDDARALLDFVGGINDLSPYGYWTLLGALYIHGGYYNYVQPKQWRRLLSANIPHKGCIMKPFEHKCLNFLPSKVICYRIHHPHEKDWISYTLSDWLVPKFVKDYREHDAFQSIEKFEVNKSDIDFYFGRNCEDEIIVLNKSKLKRLGKIKNERKFDSSYS